MAAVKTCEAKISPDLRRDLAVKLLTHWKEPSMVSYVVNEQIDALEKMPAEDRAAMCEAIKMRIEALEAVTIKK
ncbi:MULTISPECIES: hypothetical protein [unclassified Beijerinckia]|uniref:hypothetical protein n=1 Tax=unclassified Beijerinckia TaxID=2638183 RepID=UPI001114BF94|nr:MULTISPECIES: hypothetical protein [unclassified Beijerinckia]